MAPVPPRTFHKPPSCQGGGFRPGLGSRFSFQNSHQKFSNKSKPTGTFSSFLPLSMTSLIWFPWRILPARIVQRQRQVRQIRVKVRSDLMATPAVGERTWIIDVKVTSCIFPSSLTGGHSHVCLEQAQVELAEPFRGSP